MSLYRFTRKLFHYFPTRTVIAFVLISLAAIFEGMALLLLAPILELTSPQDSEPSGIQRAVTGLFSAFGLDFTLLSGLLLFFVVYVAQMGLFFLKEVTVARNQVFVKFWLRDRLYQAIFASDWPYFLRQKKGDLVSTLMIDCDKGGSAVYQYLLFWAGVVVTAAYLTTAFLISWQFTLVLIAAGLLLSLYFNKRLSSGRDVGTTTAEVNARFQGVLQESFDASKLIKVRGLENAARSLMRKETSRLAELEQYVLVNTARLRATGEPFVVAFLLIAIYVSLTFLNVQLALLVTLIFIFFRLFPRVIKMQQDYFRTLVFIPSFDRVERMIDEADANREADGTGGEVFQSLTSAIELQEVAFAYQTGKPVLEGVSMSIPKGHTVGLTGASGAGKSTICDIILGLLDPSSGRVLVDRRDLTSYDLKSWRRRIGYVSQETVLLHDTVRANILWGADSSISQDVVEQVATSANAHGFITDLENGYDTVIGDRGVRLSGGQRQRIALARALIGAPEILVLDEATSALDSESERLVMEAIRQLSGRVTVLMIAHRLSTLVDADRIYLLDSGRLVEEGSFTDLIERRGTFSKLYRMQVTSQGRDPAVFGEMP